jgi:hypothetical protein
MLTDQKLRIAWKAYLAELAAMQMTEHPLTSSGCGAVATISCRQPRWDDKSFGS